MKVTYIGATRRTGKAKATGNPYDMSMMFNATPVKSSSSANNVFTGYGHETREIELDPEALFQFEGVQLGQEIEVVVEPKPTNPRFTWVVGVKE